MPAARLDEELNEQELLELARATEQADVEREIQEEDERVEEQLPASVRRYASVVQAVRALVEGRSVDFDTLVDLTKEERDALEEMAEVLRGAEGTRFLYAEDRLSALNDTLAVLQPALSVATHGAGVELLRASFVDVVDRINTLRDQLQSLEDAEDLDLQRLERVKKAEAGDDDGDDDDAGDEGDDDAEDGEAAATPAAADGEDDQPAAAPAASKKGKPKQPPVDDEGTPPSQGEA